MVVAKSRTLFLIMFLIVLGFIGFALYLQYIEHLEPCPLCMLQRVVFIIIGLVALIACLHNPMIYGLRKYAILNSLISLGGMALAGRHIWLEQLPPNQVPACGPSLEVMLQYLPLFEVFKSAIMGSANCIKIDWSMFGLSIATWSFIGFAALLIINLNIAIKPVGKF